MKTAKIVGFYFSCKGIVTNYCIQWVFYKKSFCVIRQRSIWMFTTLMHTVREWVTGSNVVSGFKQANCQLSWGPNCKGICIIETQGALTSIWFWSTIWCQPIVGENPNLSQIPLYWNQGGTRNTGNTGNTNEVKQAESKIRNIDVLRYYWYKTGVMDNLR